MMVVILCKRFYVVLLKDRDFEHSRFWTFGILTEIALEKLTKRLDLTEKIHKNIKMDTRQLFLMLGIMKIQNFRSRSRIANVLSHYYFMVKLPILGPWHLRDSRSKMSKEISPTSGTRDFYSEFRETTLFYTVTSIILTNFPLKCLKKSRVEFIFHPSKLTCLSGTLVILSKYQDDRRENHFNFQRWKQKRKLNSNNDVRKGFCIPFICTTETSIFLWWKRVELIRDGKWTTPNPKRSPRPFLQVTEAKQTALPAHDSRQHR